jgi:hypothetical protein
MSEWARRRMEIQKIKIKNKNKLEIEKIKIKEIKINLAAANRLTYSKPLIANKLIANNDIMDARDWSRC